MSDRANGNGDYTADDAARALLRVMRAAAEPPTLLLAAREAAKALAISEKTLWTLTVPRGSSERTAGRNFAQSAGPSAGW